MRPYPLVLLFLLGCPTTVPPESPPVPPDEEICWDVPVNTCAAEGCDTLEARPVLQQDGGWCVDWDSPATPVSCAPPELICAQVLTWAAPAGDPQACHLFPTACQPPGWVACADEAMETLEDCADGP